MLIISILWIIGTASLVGSIELFRCQILDAVSSGPLNGNKSELCWGFNETHIELQLSMQTKGWISIGLSPTGQMDQSDILFGYVEDATNEVIVQDRWLTTNKVLRSINLSLDEQQDWRRIAGAKNATHTTIRAVRKLRTCDPADRSFVDLAIPVIYASYGENPANRSAPIHMHSVRGAVSINFLQSDLLNETFMEKDITKELKFTVDNVNVTSQEDTAYWCSLMRVPKLEKKQHGIATRSLVNPDNAKHIHHMTMYACDSVPEQFLRNPTFQCGPTQTNFLMKYCPSLMAAWAVGAPETYYFPSEVGQAFEADLSAFYVAIQVHYDNHDHATFTDSSGIKFLLTEKLRKYDSGMLMTGILSLDFTLTLVPGQQVFHAQGQCSDQCTSHIPKDGITIFSSGIHMHGRGLSAVVRHFRGAQELPQLGVNPLYDFNFQTSNPVIPSQKLLPGDRIIVECNYTTAHDATPIFGGESTTEEMCLAFLRYYPKSPLSNCGSVFRLPEYLDMLGTISNKRKTFLPRLGADTMNALLFGKTDENMAKRKLLNSLKEPINKFLSGQTWNSYEARKVENFYSAVNYDNICFVDGQKIVVSDDRPPAIPSYTPPPPAEC